MDGIGQDNDQDRSIDRGIMEKNYIGQAQNDSGNGHRRNSCQMQGLAEEAFPSGR